MRMPSLVDRGRAAAILTLAVTAAALIAPSPAMAVNPVTCSPCST